MPNFPVGKNSGVNNFKSKLTEKDVVDILTNDLAQKACAEKFQVSQSLISRIRRRHLWKHIKLSDYTTKP